MLTKAIEVMKYVRASAGRAGLNVVFEDTNQPRHDGSTIYLPNFTITTTEEDLNLLMSSVDHEVAHDRFSCFPLLKELDLDPSSLLMFAFNIIEDFRVNHIEAVEYRGFRNSWDSTTCVLLENLFKRIHEKDMEKNLSYNVVSDMTAWGYLLETPLYPLCGHRASARWELTKEKTKDVLHTFSSRFADVCCILDKRKGSLASYELALDILKKLTDSTDKDLIKKAPKITIKGGRDGKGGKDKKEDEGKGKGKGKFDKEGSSDEEEWKEIEDDEYKIITVKVSEEDLKKLSITASMTDRKMGKTGINFDSSEHKSTTKWDLTDYNDFIIIDYPRESYSEKDYSPRAISEYSRNFKSDYDRHVGASLVTQENFAQQVRKLIQIRAKVQTQFGVKRGKLDQSRLSRICFNAPGLSERVFKNKIENKTLDAAVTVLVDLSGSMSGQKLLYATASAVLMNEVCSTINIPLEILGFTDGYHSTKLSHNPLMYIFKSFHDLKVSHDDLLRYFGYSSHHMAGNPDGENILWAYDRLLKRKERKKILIVMSDGSPAASKSSIGLAEFTRQAIREIEKEKKVEIFGLGLCASDVVHYYKKHSVVLSPAQIAPKLLELFEKEIIHHG
jgi:hypothetical protein